MAEALPCVLQTPALEFEHHFDAKRGKCYVLEERSRVVRDPALRSILPRQTLRLWDAESKSMVGEFDAWDDAPPLKCRLADAKCTSRDEWMKLARPYLEE